LDKLLIIAVIVALYFVAGELVIGNKKTEEAGGLHQSTSM
jgi:hypothetical protein